MAERSEKEIDGVKYTFGLLNPFKANRLLMKLVKILGPAFASATGEKDIMNMDLKTVVDGLCSRLDEDEVENIVKQLFSQTLAGGKKLDDDQVIVLFSGKLGSMYKVIFAALEAQFGDFLGESGVFAGVKSLASSQKK